MKAKTSWLKRLEKLEQHPWFRPTLPPSAENRLFHDRLQQLLRQMDPQYIPVLNEAFKDLTGGPEARIAVAACRRVLDHIQKGTALAFPSALVEVFLGHPFITDNARCRQCQYVFPWGYVECCPACGVKVDYESRGYPDADEI